MCIRDSIKTIQEESVHAPSEQHSIKSFLFKNKKTTTSFQIDTTQNTSAFVSSERNIKTAQNNTSKENMILKTLNNLSETKNKKGIFVWIF